VAEAVFIVIAGTERGRCCRSRLRLETPVKGDGATMPSWSRSRVVRFGYLLHGQGGGAGEGVVHGRLNLNGAGRAVAASGRVILTWSRPV